MKWILTHVKYAGNDGNPLFASTLGTSEAIVSYVDATNANGDRVLTGKKKKQLAKYVGDNCFPYCENTSFFSLLSKKIVQEF